MQSPGSETNLRLAARKSAAVIVFADGYDRRTAMTEHGTNAPTLKRQGLYPCEAEIARRLSQSEKQWRQIAPRLEREGLPKIDPIMKGRYWPAVEAFFRERNRLGKTVDSQPDGE